MYISCAGSGSGWNANYAVVHWPQICYDVIENYVIANQDHLFQCVHTLRYIHTHMWYIQSVVYDLT